MSGTLNKFEAIAAAQDAGAVGARLSADQLLAMLLSIATSWSAGSPEMAEPDVSEEITASRRAAVVWAVERLSAP